MTPTATVAPARQGSPPARNPARHPSGHQAEPQSGHETGQPQPGPQHPSGSHDFHVTLANFEGPFDLLLGLIGKHELDVTEVALAKVTDDFIAYLRSKGPDWDLDTVSSFLVVAATLLDLKAARLLPSGEVDSDEDIALLEARDLLFARLLQYRAYKDAAGVFAAMMDTEARRFPRVVGLEERYAHLLPEVLLGLGPHEFALLAGRALAPKPPPPGVAVDHLHAPRVSVREQAALLAERLRALGRSTFRALVADCTDTAVVVGRFLALLELYREQLVMFEQVQALGDLHVRWIGGDDDDVVPVVTEEYGGEPAGTGAGDTGAGDTGAADPGVPATVPAEALPRDQVPAGALRSDTAPRESGLDTGSVTDSPENEIASSNVIELAAAKASREGGRHE